MNLTDPLQAGAKDQHTLGLEDADSFYERLLDAHAGLSREESEALNARLVLVLANQVGSSTQLAACLAAAIEALQPMRLQQI